jgi:hypothetical protein
MEQMSNIHSAKNENVRFSFFDKLDHKHEAMLGAFFRRIGLPHVYSESILPTIKEGNTLLTAALSDRSWPPWGLGAQSILALIQVHPIGESEASLSNVFVGDGDLTNIGLMGALFKETLQELIKRGKNEVNYVVIENGVFAERVLLRVGFRKTKDLILTEHARFHLFRAGTGTLLEKLGLHDILTSDLLAHNIEDSVFERNALFQSMTQLATKAYWSERFLISEIIAHTGIAVSASPPGGIGGTAGPEEFIGEIQIEERE